MTSTVTARLQLPGLHHWPNAHDSRAYLRNDHRHLFGVEVTVAVSHDERDVEFHDLHALIRSSLRHVVGQPYLPDPDLTQFGPKSCESIAQQLADVLTIGHTLSVLTVRVDEDGEAWATWTAPTEGATP